VRFKLKELGEAFEKLGLEPAEAFSAAEESVTYGTNCFDLVFSDEPYVGLRLFYDNLNEELMPVVVRIRINKKLHKIGKEAIEAILPALLSAEEDEDVMLIAARPPRARSLEELIKSMEELAKSLRKLVGEEGGGLMGYVPTDCTPFLK